MIDKINVLVVQLKSFVVRVFQISIPVAGVMIVSDVLIGTNFKVLSRLSQMTGFGLQQTLTVGLLVYLILKK